MSVLLFAFIILTLVTYRLTRFVIDDHLTQPLVARIQRWAESRYETRLIERARNALLKREAAVSQEELDSLRIVPAEDDSWRSPLAYLLNCYWCLGFYVSLLTTSLLGWAVSRFDVSLTHAQYSLIPHSPVASLVDSSSQFTPLPVLVFFGWAFAVSAATGLLATIVHRLEQTKG